MSCKIKDKAMMLARGGLGMWVIVWVLATPQVVWSGETHVAVASNFLNTLKEIAKSYNRDTGNKLILISGSTGKLYAQARHGAPFDVLLAADTKRPVLLELQEMGVAGTRFTYAVGALVLWSLEPDRVRGAESLVKMVKGKLAIAHPRTAPYGRAAKQVLERLGLWAKLQSTLVQGENIAQTLQFVATGNVQFGFVAKSQIRDPRFKFKGSSWEVPADQHEPILQQAILLKHGITNDSAKQFLRYLQGDASKKIIHSYGYRSLEE
jgi:molybdate transport system substrate-binding protein